MPTESIWGKVAPTGYTTGQNDTSTQLYTIFRTSEATTLAGVSFYSNPAANKLPAATAIFAVGNTTPLTVNTSPTWDGAAGSGWVTTTNETAISLDADTDYIVCIVGPASAGGNSWLCFITPATFPITNGAVTAPSSSGSLTNSPYINQSGSSTPLYPTSSTSIEWFVDVQLTPAGSPVSGTGAVTLKKMTTSGTGNVTGTFSVAFNSSSGGIDTYDVTSQANGSGTHSLRILRPTDPDPAYPHSFFYTLEVLSDGAFTYGDALSIAQSLGLHNTYNTTIVSIGYAIDPWYADNPDDPAIHQDTHTVWVAEWVNANLAVTGTEKNYLIGFSKSGIGGLDMLFRHPDIFYKGAIWDTPIRTTYNSFSTTDEDSAVYGTQASFAANYEMSTANLTNWEAPFVAENRLWIGVGSSYTGETEGFHTTITSLGYLHDYDSTTFAGEAHAWHADWITAGASSIFSQQNSGHVTLKKMTAAASGTEIDRGTASVTLKKMTVSASGNIKVPGTASVTLKKMTVSGSGRLPITGNAAVIMRKMTVAASGNIKIPGTISVTMRKMQVHASDGHAAGASSLFIFSQL